VKESADGGAVLPFKSKGVQKGGIGGQRKKKKGPRLVGDPCCEERGLTSSAKSPNAGGKKGTTKREGRSRCSSKTICSRKEHGKSSTRK